MLIREKDIRIIKYFLVIGFVYLSLNPCHFKIRFFETPNADYSKPLNKTKATSPSCQYSFEERQLISILKNLKSKRKSAIINTEEKQYFILYATAFFRSFSKTFSGNSPPKYNLFKRLRLGMAEQLNFSYIKFYV